jgi:sodium-dependent dicarboxylate transporter 2/3/5
MSGTEESRSMDPGKEAPATVPGMTPLKRLGHLMVAGIILLITLLAPSPDGLSTDGKNMIGVLIIAAYLWVTEALPAAVTGVLVIVLQPLLGILDASEVFLSFGNKAVFFLIGAFMIAAAIEKHNLHKRIALKFLVHFERNPRMLTLGILLISAFMSFIVPEHAVAALMLPIGISILLALRVIPRMSNFGKVIMISIAYGCSIGSLGTVVGGARNPLTIAFLQEAAGLNVTFLDWAIYSMPIVLIGLPLVWVVLIKTYPIEIKSLEKAKKVLDDEVSGLGSLKKGEMTTLGVLVFTVVLWVFVSHTIGLAVIALLGATFLFLGGSIEWKDAEKRIPWGIVILYGGAISLGIGMDSTGAAAWLVGGLPDLVGNNPMVIMVILVLVTLLLTEFMSNVAAVALMLPIALGFANAVEGLSILAACMVVALSGGQAFMLVIATPGNAITYSSGYYSLHDLAKVGIRAHVVGITVIILIAFTYWRLIGLW